MSELDLAKEELETALDQLDQGNVEGASTRVASAISAVNASNHSIMKLDGYMDELQQYLVDNNDLDDYAIAHSKQMINKALERLD